MKTKYLFALLFGGLLSAPAFCSLPVATSKVPGNTHAISGEKIPENRAAGIRKPRQAKNKEKNRGKTRRWFWFAALLALTGIFAYLSLSFFILANTAEVCVGFFEAGRWAFLASGLVCFGLGIRQLVRALRA